MTCNNFCCWLLIKRRGEQEKFSCWLGFIISKDCKFHITTAVIQMNLLHDFTWAVLGDLYILNLEYINLKPKC